MKKFLLLLVLLSNSLTFASIDDQTYISNKINEIKHAFLDAGYYYASSNGNYAFGKKITAEFQLDEVLSLSVPGYNSYQEPFSVEAINSVKSCLRSTTCKVFNFRISMTSTDSQGYYAIVTQQVYFATVEDDQETGFFIALLDKSYI